MSIISSKDKEILRSIADRKLKLATNSENDAILKKWVALGNCKRESPTVRLLFSNFRHEIINPQMQCEGYEARGIEHRLLSSIAGRELFEDDTPLTPTYDVENIAYCKPFGLEPKRTRAEGDNAVGFHIDELIVDLEAEFDKLHGGSFGVDLVATENHIELINDTIGDILPVRRVMSSLKAAMTSPLVHLMGMEQFYISMYDCPDKVQEAMEMACRMYEKYYDYLEQNKLLFPYCDTAPLGQESFAFNNVLSKVSATKTTDCWGFMESQETTAVSADMFGEFVFPYQDRLAKRFGLLSYGCCERVDAIWEGYLSKWENLRKLSVSPFNNERLVGEYLRGNDVVFYSKPRAEYLTMPQGIDEDAIKDYFKMLAENASGCLFEVAQREVGTIYGDISRGRRYVEIAKEMITQYWKP